MQDVYNYLLKYHYRIDCVVRNGRFIINEDLHLPSTILLNFSPNSLISVFKPVIESAIKRNAKLLIFYNEKIASITPQQLNEIKSLKEDEKYEWVSAQLLDDYEINKIYPDKRTIDFIQLHLHTEYSVLDGIIRPKQLINFAAEHGISAVCVTDHGSMGCHLPLFLYAQEKNVNVKPLFGIEAYMVEDATVKSEKNKKNHHITLIAKNEIGYKNLLALNRYGVDHFYYRPRIDVSTLLKHSEGIICLSACMGGYLHNLIIENGFVVDKNIKDSILQFVDVFGDDFYFEIMPLDYDGVYDQLNYVLLSFAKNNHINTVATNDVHFLYADQAEAHQKFIKMISHDFGFENKDIYYKDKNEMVEAFKVNCPHSVKRFKDEIHAALDVPQEIVDKCDFAFQSFHTGEFHIPQFYYKATPHYKEIDWKEIDFDAFPDFVTSKKERFFCVYLYDLLYDYLDNHKKDGLDENKYMSRVDYELKQIISLDVIDYFLIVDDIINFCERHDILLHCRGSVGGSLIAFLLGFTKFDPLVYDISFDRFISPARIESGENDIDVDIDFESTKRDFVYEYVRSKYGEDRVCKIGAYQRLQMKQAVKSLASVEHKLIEAELEEMKLSDEYDSEDIDEMVRLKDKFAFQTTNAVTRGIFLQPGDAIDNLFELGLDEDGKKWFTDDDCDNYLWYIKNVKPFVGVIKSKSIHAAGVIITPDDFSGYLSVSRSKQDHIITEAENSHTGGEFLNSFGILTLDMLGSKTLSQFKDAFGLIEERHGVRVGFDTINLEDEILLKNFAKGNTYGVFQFGATRVTKYLKEMKPNSFSDIIATNALNRPGPLDSNAHVEFARRKKSPDLVEYHNKDMQKILGDTYGIPIYSEHMMRIATDFAGLTSLDAETLRKLQKAKSDEKFRDFKNKFINSAVAKYTAQGEDEDFIRRMADDVWRLIEHHGKYNFPKSHATAYSLYAMISMYLKVYYPNEFFTAWLNNLSNSEEMEDVMDEAIKCGVKFSDPDINLSEDKFVLKGNVIMHPLTSIKQVGEAAYNGISKVRPVKSVEELNRKLKAAKTKTSKRAIFNLIIAGAFDFTGKDSYRLLRDYCDDRNEDVPDSLAGKSQEELDMEKTKLLKVDNTDYVEKYQHLVEKIVNKVDKSHDILKSPIETEHAIVAKVSKIKAYKSKKGEMGFITLKVDGTKIECVMFDKSWSRFAGKSKPKVDDIVLVQCSKHMRKGSPNLHINRNHIFFDLTTGEMTK